MPGPLPKRRTDGFEETLVRVTRTGGFTLRRVFYTVPSRLVGHRLRVRLYDDRLVLLAGTEEVATLPRGRAGPGGRRGRVVDYRHVLPSLRRKPMALLDWVCRDDFFPRDAYRHTFDALREGVNDAARPAAGSWSCSPWPATSAAKAGLATELEALLAARTLPDLAVLRKRFAAKPGQVPELDVHAATLPPYDDLASEAAACPAGGPS